ncbi:cytochrome P450 [Leucogyrophana mollusca]|uniref:Cytochrome P450 n=1 Tax=Leucogyrophana mollusca TaxID=85980 RepID=A0ACB8BC91_9AGAM|nr:cytochrome P450 [Leucogyrophana mollusca]
MIIAGSDALILIGATSLVCYHFLNRRWKIRSGGFPLPPGPQRRLLVRNLFDLPVFEPWKRFAFWSEEYGDLVYLRTFGTGILALNSIEAVNELFEKRSQVYSDRPTFVMAGELIGFDQTLAFAHYGTSWRQQRKLAHSALNSEAVKKYHQLQEHVVALYLESLVSDPTGYASAIHLQYLDDMVKMMDLVTEYFRPGAFLVDLIPQLKHLPTWLPFNNIHQIAAAGRELLLRVVDRPFLHVKRQFEEGTAPPSYVAHCLEQHSTGDAGDDMDYYIRWSANTMYGAGAETTYGTIITFIYIMALYPDVQAKGIEEIHRVVGLDRLPTLGDRDQLPYVNAIIKELYRYNPVVPLSLPRTNTEDDVYRGCFIPKNTLILPNVWAISRDQDSGIPPEDFVPERFMPSHVKQTATDPLTYTFGFGRRLCPGRFLGDNSVFLFISGLLAAFDITQKRDENGGSVPMDVQFVPGMVSYPQPFPVDIVPRSHHIVAAVKSRAAAQ